MTNKMNAKKYPYIFDIIEERADTHLWPLMEPVTFAYLSEVMVMKAAVSKLHPIIQHVANEWQIKLSTARGFRTVQRIIINSIKNN